jgi:LmeA-like phospholipid-binding
MRPRGWAVLVVVLLVLGGGLLIADRVAASLAADQVATRLGGHRPFTSKPEVTIRGFPFLTQALAGRYSHITVSGSDAVLAVPAGGQLSGVGFHADLHGVHLPVGTALSGRVDRLPVDRIEGTVSIPFSQLDGLTDGAVTLGHQGSDLVVTGTVSLPGYGSVAARGVGSLHVSGARLSVALRSVTVAGQQLPQNLVQAAVAALSPHLRVPTLPYRLKLLAVRPSADGVVLSGRVTDVVIVTQGTG